MRSLWRISTHNDLHGLGGEKSDGRWHTAARGKRVVYLSEHPAVSLIETLVNLKGNPKLFPATYRLMKVGVAESVSTDAVRLDSLSKNWRDDTHETRALGDAWWAKRESALLAVPSAPAPESTNYIFNPLHSDAGGVAIEWDKALAYDRRLFAFLTINGPN